MRLPQRLAAGAVPRRRRRARHGARILYVGGYNCNAGIDIALSKILDGRPANIVSNSYGNQGEAVSANYLFGQVNLELQAAGEGIGLYYSRGDSGDEAANLGYASPDFPASSPWVSAVGGTSLAVAQDGSYQFETGWGDARDQIVNGAYNDPLPGPFRFGAGGGVSAAFAQPDYQKGVVPSSLAQGKRVSPDVASDADPYTGHVVGISPITDNTTLATGPFAIFTYGGTSLACPLTAGQMAVAQQVSGKVLGFANPAIYATSRRSGTVQDVVPPPTQQALAFTSPSTGSKYLVSLNLDTSLTTATGYDDVTGLGSMNYQFALAVARQGRHGWPFQSPRKARRRPRHPGAVGAVVLSKGCGFIFFDTVVPIARMKVAMREVPEMRLFEPFSPRSLSCPLQHRRSMPK